MLVCSVWLLSACQGTVNPSVPASKIGASQKSTLYAKQLLLGFQATGSKEIDERLVTLPEESLWQALEKGEVQAIVLLDDDIPAGQWTSAIGWTALTFAVNPQNPIRDVSRSAIKDIYQGRISNWMALGGADEAITRYAFINGSEIDRVFSRVVLEGGRLAPDVFAAPGAWAMSLAAEDDPSALVHMLCPYDLAGLKGLMVDGVPSNYANARDEKYPFRIPVLMTAVEPVEDAVLHFAAWAQSADGQAVFRRECAAGGN